MTTTDALQDRPRERSTIPVTLEATGFDLPVDGAIPPELTGRFVRNGPNPRPGHPVQHLFLGDGMVHGVRLGGGRASWYRNRWVRTRSFEGTAQYRAADGTIDLTASVANTSVVAHGGALLALVESSFPYRLGDELQTLGVHDFNGKLTTPFTAHPKRCPRTGELHAYGMSVTNGLTYHRIARDGTLVESRAIPTPAVTMMHDMALTNRHVIFLDLPVVFDLERARQGTMPFRWSDAYGARLGVLRRDDAAAPVRWYPIAPCYVFHVLNAYDDGDRIVLDAVRYADLWRENPNAFGATTLHRWTIDQGTGTVAETTLDERSTEFPTGDPRRTGSQHRYGYAVRGDEQPGSIVVKYDLAGTGSSEHTFGAGFRCGEALFVPDANDRAEDAGWLMTFVYDAARDASTLTILDASTLAPVASIALPQRVPSGFHGAWVDDTAR